MNPILECLSILFIPLYLSSFYLAQTKMSVQNQLMKILNYINKSPIEKKDIGHPLRRWVGYWTHYGIPLVSITIIQFFFKKKKKKKKKKNIFEFF